MAIATKAKPNIEDGLSEREQKLSEASAAADRLARELGGKLKEAQALIDQRRQLVHHQPELVTHTGEPTARATRFWHRRELRKLGDLEDLRAQAEHARRPPTSAQPGTEAFRRCVVAFAKGTRGSVTADDAARVICRQATPPVSGEAFGRCVSSTKTLILGLRALRAQ